ncbi:cysteine desulfurase family protein [Spirochaetia bacterium 38H-sp]|uniref:Cysteine desulfurase family protein n=1 Tax=Rarispira pelagica TaxID=3141764 RepID=A0ABU9UCG6_9SPIR
MSVYLDWAATAIPYKEAIEEQTRVCSDFFGNPSSLHEPGRAARRLLDSCRSDIASMLSVRPEQLVFCSGATEANNIALLSVLTRRKRGHVIVSAIEHSSGYEPALLLSSMGYDVDFIRPDASGIISPVDIANRVREDTVLVSVMLVNNETGAIQPVREIVQAVRTVQRRNIHVHCDVVQASGKIAFNLTELGVDSASISAHKFGGVRGAGIMFAARQWDVLIRGGGQEQAMRPGTENVAAVAAMRRALEISEKEREKNSEHAIRLKKELIDGISNIKGAEFLPVEVTKKEKQYIPHILSVSFPPVPGEVLQRVLSDAGFYVSTGSACSSRARRNSRVMDAMGISDRISFSAIRISTGYLTTEADITEFLRFIKREIPLLMKIAR